MRIYPVSKIQTSPLAVKSSDISAGLDGKNMHICRDKSSREACMDETVKELSIIGDGRTGTIASSVP